MAKLRFQVGKHTVFVSHVGDELDVMIYDTQGDSTLFRAETLTVMDSLDVGDGDDLMDRSVTLADLAAWGRSMEGGDTSRLRE